MNRVYHSVDLTKARGRMLTALYINMTFGFDLFVRGKEVFPLIYTRCVPR